MYIDEVVLDYLKGARFSNGKSFHVPAQGHIIQRNDRLVELARGKSVLHLGCADHAILIEKKIGESRYLHKLLEKATSRLVGVDINLEAIAKMQSLGFEDIYLPVDVPKEHYDLLIVADVIEHLPNVREFFDEIQRYDFGHLLVTTPNAFRQMNRWQIRAETINTDHRYWFSPYTLARVLVDAGYTLVSIDFTDRPSNFNLLRNLILRRFPLLQDGLLAVAKK